MFEIGAARIGKADAELIDPAGKIVKKASFEIAAGVNRLLIDDTNMLPPGLYFLRVKMLGTTIQNRVIKQIR